MSAYDVAAWSDFANTVAGGAAALAGLLFVGLSLNLAEVLKYPGVPARAAVSLWVQRGGGPGNCLCGNGFHRRDSQRLGAAGRAQTLAGSETRLAATTISGGRASSSTSIAI